MKTWERIAVYLAFIAVSFGFLLYSFTQIDLGLTVSKFGIIQNVQRWFSQIGYFERPLSLYLYIALLCCIFSLYAIMLFFSYRKKVTLRTVGIVIGILVFILFLSYPSFSYDFFNYMFTAKTVALYHKNPYAVIPLDFTGFDPWILFMRWTHLPSAYTPLWIILTLPVYLLSLGVFLSFVFLLKALFTLSYILSCVAVFLVSKKEKLKNPELVLVAFALNPLVIIETLISPHNDIVMMALVLWAYVFFVEKKRWISFFLFALSVALKFMTIFLIPLYFLKWNRKIALCCMLVGFSLVLVQREVLPWYFLWLIPFLSLLSEYPEVLVMLFGSSIALLLRYTPYLYLGNWDPPATQWKMLVTVIPVLFAFVISGVLSVKRLLRSK